MNDNLSYEQAICYWFIIHTLATILKQKLITSNWSKNMTDNTTLELADVITGLRKELIKAQQEGDGESIRFNVNNVEVELETVVTKEADGKLGMKFWVVEANAGGKYQNASKQKIKLTLQAVNIDPVTGQEKNTQLSGEE